MIEFSEKPDIADHWINGGFFQRKFRQRVTEDENCALEREPLVRLVRDGQLNIYRHRGYWACMDTQRGHEQLIRLVESGDPPWLR